MLRNCTSCKAEFKTYPSRVALGRGKYCSRRCSDAVTLIKRGQHLSPGTEHRPGEKPHNFRGVSYTTPRRNGRTYRLIYKPDHPHATKKGYVREHRLVMEAQLGRLLEPDEIVDHIDRFDTLNNESSNLRVMTKREHDRMNVNLNIHRRWHG